MKVTTKKERISGSITIWLRSRGCELAKFGMVGGLGVIVYYGILWSLVEVIRIPVLTSTSIAYLVVTTQNYILHFTWTFRSVRSHAVSLPRFLLLNLVGFFINWVIMFLGVELIEQHYLIVQAASIVLIATFNFVLSAHWIFLCAPNPFKTHLRSVNISN